MSIPVIKHLSKESFIELMQYIIDEIAIRKVHFNQKEPLPQGRSKKGNLFLNDVSLEIPLSGIKHICYASEGKIQDVTLEPGEILFSAPMHWKTPQWDSFHTMSSILFFSEYVRITYIEFNRLSSSYEYRPAEIFYHTSIPLISNGKSILGILSHISESGDKTGAEDLLKALLKSTLKTLQNDTFELTGKAQKTWLQIRHYLLDNFSSPINRAHVAYVFKITPSYVSQLFKSHGDESFNHMLRRLRLEHATALLKHTNLTVDEITDRCGYLSSTYFISAFHKHFGLPPGKYRNFESSG